MPPKAIALTPTRAPTVQKCTVSSKLHDEKNINDVAVSAQNGAQNSTTSRQSISPSIEEVNDEEVGCTFKHPQNPEQILKQSDRSDDNDKGSPHSLSH